MGVGGGREQTQCTDHGLQAPQVRQDPVLRREGALLGKDWHTFLLKCERCDTTLMPEGHAEHNRKPFCHSPAVPHCLDPKGRTSEVLAPTSTRRPLRWDRRSLALSRSPWPDPRSARREAPQRGPAKPLASPRSPRNPTFFLAATRGSALLRKRCLSARTGTSQACACERCRKTLTPEGHDGQTYRHQPCCRIPFRPRHWSCGQLHLREGR